MVKGQSIWKRKTSNLKQMYLLSLIGKENHVWTPKFDKKEETEVTVALLKDKLL